MEARRQAYQATARVFRDRVEAGKLLAERLDRYRGPGVLVLGIPRGGVVVAAEVARQLDAELDVVVARKLGAPFSPELAIGAVTANGGRFLDEDLIDELGITAPFLEAAIAAESAEARRRERRFRNARAMAPMQGRTVIVVDDGLARGATMRAAVRSVRQRRPARLVVAVPVGSREACDALRAEADAVVCLQEPEPFWAVGLYYEHFEPVEDTEVERLLDEAYRRREASPARPAAAPAPTATQQAVGAADQDGTGGRP